MDAQPGLETELITSRNRAKECILGIDLGATSLRFARVDADGGELFHVPTPSGISAEAVVTRAAVRAAAGMHVAGLGLSRAPGLDEQGRVNEWPSRPDWKGLPLILWLAEAADADVISADDGPCAALWEHRSLGAAEDTVTACISIGTGLAIGVVAGGEILPGGDGSGTLSHERFADLDLPCRCGKRGCLQTVLSVSGMEEAVGAARVGELRKAFAQFLHALKERFGVQTAVITGGGVERFGRDFLNHTLIGCARAAGVALEISSTPALSATGGALFLACRNMHERAAWWHEQVSRFIFHESVRFIAPAPMFAESSPHKGSHRVAPATHWS